MLRKLGVLFLCLWLSISVLGCADNSSYYEALWGKASLDEPIVDATVKVYNSNGKLIFSNDGETHTTGAFIIQYGGVLPSEFTLEVTGGTLYNEPFTGKLRRKVIGHVEYKLPSDIFNYYRMNEFTTLIDLYMERNTGASMEEAEDAVRDYFGFSEITELASGEPPPASQYSSASFMSNAKDAGGLDQYVTQLIEDIENGGTYSGGELQLSSAAGNIFKVIGEGLLEGAGELAIGTILEVVIAGIEMHEAEETIDALNELSVKITELTKTVEKVAAEDRYTTEIDKLEEACTSKMKNHYIQLTAITEAKHCYSEQKDGDVKKDCENYPKVDADTIKTNAENLRIAILTPDANGKSMDVCLSFIDEYLFGDGGKTPLLENWTENLISSQEGGNVSENLYPKIEAFYSYWIGIQLKTLMLIVEAYKADDPDIHSQTYINTYKDNIYPQVEHFLGKAEKYIWFYGHQTCLKGDCSYYNQEFAPVSLSSGAYTPPVDFASADKLAAVFLIKKAGYTVRLFDYKEKADSPKESMDLSKLDDIEISLTDGTNTINNDTEYESCVSQYEDVTDETEKENYIKINCDPLKYGKYVEWITPHDVNDIAYRLMYRRYHFWDFEPGTYTIEVENNHTADLNNNIKGIHAVGWQYHIYENDLNYPSDQDFHDDNYSPKHYGTMIVDAFHGLTLDLSSSAGDINEGAGCCDRKTNTYDFDTMPISSAYIKFQLGSYEACETYVHNEPFRMSSFKAYTGYDNRHCDPLGDCWEDKGYVPNEKYYYPSDPEDISYDYVLIEDVGEDKPGDWPWSDPVHKYCYVDSSEIKLYW